MLLALIWGPLSDDPLATGRDPVSTPAPCTYGQASSRVTSTVTQAATTLDTGAMRITATVVAREKAQVKCTPKPLAKPEFRPQSFKMCMKPVAGGGIEMHPCDADRDS